MLKKTKLTIQIIILILIILGVGYYFINEFYLKNKYYKFEKSNITLEQIFEFKVMRNDLNEEQIQDYQDRFDSKVLNVFAAEDNFNFSALNSIGNIKRILYDFEGARDVWEYVGYMREENSLSFFNLGNLYAEDLKDNKKAEENFLKCLENSTGEAGNEQYYLGIVNFYKYYYSEKKQKIEKILLDSLKTEEYKNNQTILSLLATYYGDNNQPIKALEYWQKILVMDPENEGVKLEIENLK